MAPARAHATLDQRLAAAETLSPTERRIAEFFLAERERLPFLTAEGVAASLGVSRLSVLRAARTLGYDGLAQLKEELAHALQRSTAARRFVETAAHLDARDGGPLDRAMAFQLEALQETRRTADAATVRRAVDVLAKAERIVTYGQETARPLAHAFAQRLRRTGWQTLTLEGSGIGLADELIQVRRRDAIVVIADESDPHIAVILEHARSARVPCVLVTNTLGLAMRGRYAVVLSARRGATGDAPTMAADLLILETLLLGLAARRPNEVRAAGRRLGSLRGRLAPAPRTRTR